MTKEENKAIFKLREIIDYDKKHRLETIFDKEQIEVRNNIELVLDLTEKLQKENGELKEKNDNNNVYKDLQEDLTSLLKKEFIPKDKIRELLENNYDISSENSRSMSYDGAFGFVEDIEELLEEE